LSGWTSRSKSQMTGAISLWGSISRWGGTLFCAMYIHTHSFCRVWKSWWGSTGTPHAGERKPMQAQSRRVLLTPLHISHLSAMSPSRTSTISIPSIGHTRIRLELAMFCVPCRRCHPPLQNKIYKLHTICLGFVSAANLVTSIGQEGCSMLISSIS
jgi:hypothetical protein